MGNLCPPFAVNAFIDSFPFSYLGGCDLHTSAWIVVVCWAPSFGISFSSSKPYTHIQRPLCHTKE